MNDETKLTVNVFAQRIVTLRSINDDGTVTLNYNGTDYRLLPRDSLSIQVEINRSIGST